MRPDTQPTNRHADLKQNCVSLFFGGEKDTGIRFYMRGAVCFPMSWPGHSGGNEISGHILLAGLDIETKDITIFKEQRFATVSNVIEDGVITFPGLETFFNTAWAGFYCRDFYWHGNEVTTRQWRLETIRNGLIDPKPFFLNVDWSEDDQAALLMWQALKTEKLNLKPIGRKSDIAVQLNKVKIGDKIEFPAVNALIALIAGFNMYPWRGNG